jgi:porin
MTHPLNTCARLLAACALAVPMAVAQEAEEEAAKDFWNRDTLTGDWGGLRTRLEERGLTVDMTYIAEMLVSAGAEEADGGIFRGDLTIDLIFDTEQAGWWKGGEFGMQFMTEHGASLTDRYIGDFQILSNIDGPDFAQLNQVWYRQEFLDGKLWFKLGKLDANEDFAWANYTGEFLNSSAAFSPTVQLVTYPDPDLGILVGAQPWEWFSLQIGVYNQNADGGRPLGRVFTELKDPLVLVQPEFHYNIRQHPGNLRLGYWWSGQSAPLLGLEEEESAASGPADWLALYGEVRQSGLARTYLSTIGSQVAASLADRITTRLLDRRDERGHSHGFYLTWDQQVYRENPDVEDDVQGIGLFAQYGWADRAVSEANHYAGLGMEWTGAFPRRDDDIFGVGVFHVRFSGRAGFEKRHETAVELFYKAQLTPWMSVKPDVQVIVNPGGSDARTAVAAGLRMEIAF